MCGHRIVTSVPLPLSLAVAENNYKLFLFSVRNGKKRMGFFELNAHADTPTPMRVAVEHSRTLIQVASLSERASFCRFLGGSPPVISVSFTQTDCNMFRVHMGRRVEYVVHRSSRARPIFKWENFSKINSGVIQYNSFAYHFM